MTARPARPDGAGGELWRPVAGWEGLYEVSDAGRVRSLGRSATDRRGRPWRMGGRVLTQSALQGGWRTVTLHGEGRRQTRSVHGLVAAAFVGPRPPRSRVQHLDGDRSNNRAGNLVFQTDAAPEGAVA